MQPLREQLTQDLLKLAWSLWAELRVAGVQRSYHDVLIDPEVLIFLTASLTKENSRFR